MIDESKIFKAFKADYEKAKTAKIEIDKLIKHSNDLYYGYMKNNQSKKLLMKEVAKMIEYMKPNIIEPFLSTSSPIKITRAGNSKFRTEVENYVNGVFVGDLNREELISDIADVLLREGTVWTRSGWVRERRKKTTTKDMTMQDLLSLDKEPDSLNQLGEDLFEVTETIEQVVKNHPNTRICRNENCFPDPTARQEKEMNFFIEKRYVTYYDLKKMGIYSAKKLNILKSKILSSADSSSNNKGLLEASRDSEDPQTMNSLDNYTEDLNRHKVKLIEYWGYYDLYNKGIKTSVVSSWIEDFDLFMEVDETPMPSKKIPYTHAVYSSRPFSLWGNSVAFFIGENQNVKNGVVRGILDSVALANNGQKFIQRGALDFVNLQRLKNRDRYVIVNKPDGISDGKYNNIPGSTFNLLDMVNQESSQLVGVDGAPALSKASIAKDSDTNISLSQQKMISIVRSISGLLSRNVKEWIEMSEIFLDDEQIIELFSNDDNDENDRADLNTFRNSSNTMISLNVGTSVSKQQELQQLNMLMQQSKVLGEQLPEGHINHLVAQMFDLFDMHVMANKLRNFKHEPTEAEQATQQMQMQEAQLKLAKLQKEIEEIQSRTELNSTSAKTKMVDAQSGADYKSASASEKRAKTEGHQVDTALKPGEAAMAMNEKFIQLKEGNANGK